MTRIISAARWPLIALACVFAGFVAQHWLIHTISTGNAAQVSLATTDSAALAQFGATRALRLLLFFIGPLVAGWSAWRAFWITINSESTRRMAGCDLPGRSGSSASEPSTKPRQTFPDPGRHAPGATTQHQRNANTSPTPDAMRPARQPPSNAQTPPRLPQRHANTP
ncbi:MAG: hypothetical protein ACI82G_003033 [Bradymonadia bacterium]|jgi:hypothetical protein